MTGPTFSPDGQWMWTGDEWIPAPPKSAVVTTNRLDDALLASVSKATNVHDRELARMAGYFDNNRDGRIDRYEMEQAARASTIGPIGAAPGFDRSMIESRQAIQRGPQHVPQPNRIASPPVVVMPQQQSNLVVAFIGVAVIVVSLFLPYISVLGLVEYTGLEMMMEAAELFTEFSDDGMDGGSVDNTDVGSGSEADLTLEEWALVLATLMLVASPFVYALIALVAGGVLLTGQDFRWIGVGHMAYSLTFLISGALSPSFLDVSIMDFLGVGFYMGSFAWVLLLVK
jgi:hypothetical protein